MFSEGVVKGRITENDFVRLTATAPAQLFGLRSKGSLMPGCGRRYRAVGPARRVTITNALMQQAIDYTPYEGMEVTGWPVSTIRRGQVVMRDGIVQANPAAGAICQCRLMT